MTGNIFWCLRMKERNNALEIQGRRTNFRINRRAPKFDKGKSEQDANQAKIKETEEGQAKGATAGETDRAFLQVGEK